MTRRRTEGNETWARLLDWPRGQAASERLAAHILRAEGFESVDPCHPLGGADGLKDALCVRDGRAWIGAAYFPRGQQSFQKIEAKFRNDLKGVRANHSDSIAFVTNQELRLAERHALKILAGDAQLELFHLERIASLLDSPQYYGLRLEYLDIEMTREEQVSFISTRDSIITQLKSEISHLRSDIVSGLGRLEQRLASGNLEEKPNIGTLARIPAGSFIMGFDEADEHHWPLHEVYTEAFSIDRYPITNGQFKSFVDECQNWGKESAIKKHSNVYYLFLWQGDMYPRGKKDHPVVWVNWLAAAAYCNWRSRREGLEPCYDPDDLFACNFDNQGYRLPTEAEYEKTARAGHENRLFPWGHHIDESMANFGNVVADTTEVGEYAPNNYGLYDIAGNVKEWCHDWYGKAPLVPAGVRPDSGGPEGGEFKVFKGGSWGSNERELNCSYRAWLLPANTNPDFGFRCVCHS